MKAQICPMYHPAAALHQPRLWAVQLDDWANPPGQVDHDFIISQGAANFGDGMTYSLDTENAPDGSLGQWSVAYRDGEGRLTVRPFYGSLSAAKLGGRCVMQNAKWDIRVLQRAGITPPANVVDTMIAAYCLGLGRQEPTDTGKAGDQMVGGLGLKYLARRHLGMRMKEWKEVKDHPELVPEYNADDSIATFLLWEKWEKLLPEHFWSIDTPLLPVLMAMEDRGVHVDPTFLDEYQLSLERQIAEIDLPLNPNANQEIASYVYGTLGIEPTRFTDTGQPTTDAAFLETIDDPVVQAILAWGKLDQERATYANNYVKLKGQDNRIHGEIKQTSTATARLSMARPNLQNVVKDSELRRLFLGPFVRIDWSKMELWGYAILAKDEVMLAELQSGRSPYKELGKALGWNMDDPTQYRDVKVVVLLMNYAGGPWKISNEFHIPLDDAKEIEAKYYNHYKGIKRYHTEQKIIAHRDKVVVNAFGRKRRLDAMFSDDWRIRQEGEREAINTPIQSTCAEIVKLAMIDLHNQHQAPMVLQVHDELLFEFEDNPRWEKEAEEYAHWLTEYAPKITPLGGVCLPVECTWGKTWKDCMK